MISAAFEMTRDLGLFTPPDGIDPYDSCEAVEATGKGHPHWGRNGGAGDGGYGLAIYHEQVNEPAKGDISYGTTKFRVAVDATPEEIAEMEKK